MQCVSESNIHKTTRAIAFDWGGVFTIGTFDGRSTARLSEKYNLDVLAVRQHYFEIIRHIEVGEWSLEKFWQELSARIGLTSVAYQDFEDLYLASVLRNEAMYSFLPSIPKHFQVGLLSNNYPVVADMLDHDPSWARFNTKVFSNRIGVKKPDARAFEILSAALAVPAAQTVFVDDVEENVLAARNLGFSTIRYDAAEHQRFLTELKDWMNE